MEGGKSVAMPALPAQFHRSSVATGLFLIRRRHQHDSISRSAIDSTQAPSYAQLRDGDIVSNRVSSNQIFYDSDSQQDQMRRWNHSSLLISHETRDNGRDRERLPPPSIDISVSTDSDTLHRRMLLKDEERRTKQKLYDLEELESLERIEENEETERHKLVEEQVAVERQKRLEAEEREKILLLKQESRRQKKLQQQDIDASKLIELELMCNKLKEEKIELARQMAEVEKSRRDVELQFEAERQQWLVNQVAQERRIAQLEKELQLLQQKLSAEEDKLRIVTDAHIKLEFEHNLCAEEKAHIRLAAEREVQEYSRRFEKEELMRLRIEEELEVERRRRLSVEEMLKQRQADVELLKAQLSTLEKLSKEQEKRASDECERLLRNIAEGDEARRILEEQLKQHKLLDTERLEQIRYFEQQLDAERHKRLEAEELGHKRLNEIEELKRDRALYEQDERERRKVEEHKKNLLEDEIAKYKIREHDELERRRLLEIQLADAQNLLASERLRHKELMESQLEQFRRAATEESERRKLLEAQREEEVRKNAELQDLLRKLQLQLDDLQQQRLSLAQENQEREKRHAFEVEQLKSDVLNEREKRKLLEEQLERLSSQLKVKLDADRRAEAEEMLKKRLLEEELEREQQRRRDMELRLEEERRRLEERLALERRQQEEEEEERRRRKLKDEEDERQRVLLELSERRVVVEDKPKYVESDSDQKNKYEWRTPSSKHDEKKQLTEELQRLRLRRNDMEGIQIDQMKRVKYLQSKHYSSNNKARDMWKKKYFEEKKKTSPLEDSASSLRHELEQNYHKLIENLKSTGDVDVEGSAAVNETKKQTWIEAKMLEHGIDQLHTKIQNTKLRLTTEMKLRYQSECELQALRADLAHKKVKLMMVRSKLYDGNDILSTAGRAHHLSSFSTYQQL